MRSFIKSIVFFSVFASLFYGFAILVTGKILPKRFLGNIMTENKISANDLSNKRFGNFKKYKSIDLVIIGSSHAYRGYDVRLFDKSGFTSYNFGSSSQTSTLTEVIYKTVVNDLSPSIMIIDIYPILFTKTAEEGELNLMPLFYNNLSFIKSTFNNFDVRVTNSLIYFQVFGNANNVKSTIPKDEEYVDGGYISSFRSANKSKKYTSSILKFEKENIDALKRVVDDAEKRRIKVFLFQAPLPAERYKSYINNEEVDSIMKSIGNYNNYNEVRSLPAEYFMDDSHINQHGVNVYNKWVLDKIKEND